jgi:hypothetical protein
MAQAETEKQTQILFGASGPESKHPDVKSADEAVSHLQMPSMTRRYGIPRGIIGSY